MHSLWDPSYVPVWIAISVMVPGILNAVASIILNAKMGRTENHVIETRSNIDELEKSTNSNFDQLVKLTAEASHAKGKLEGKEERSATPDVSGKKWFFWL